MPARWNYFKKTKRNVRTTILSSAAVGGREREKMSKQKFVEKYGKNRKSKARFNLAIRSESPGGNELLDLLETVSHMRQRAGGSEDFKKLQAIENGLQNIRNAMAEAIMEAYDF